MIEDLTAKKKPGPKTKKTSFYFECALCDFSCCKDIELKDHVEKSHLKDLFKFPCEFCGFEAKGPKYLRQHKSENHPNKENQPEKGKNVGLPTVVNPQKVERIEEIQVISEPFQLDTAVNEEATIEKISNNSISMKSFVENQINLKPKVVTKRRRSKFETSEESAEENKSKNGEDSEDSRPLKSRKYSDFICRKIVFFFVFLLLSYFSFFQRYLIFLLPIN